MLQNKINCVVKRFVEVIPGKLMVTAMLARGLAVEFRRDHGVRRCDAVSSVVSNVCSPASRIAMEFRHWAQ